MESSGEADLWSPSLSEWQPLLGDLMAGEDETAADWGPEEDDEEDYNEDGEEYEEEQEEEEEEEELLEVEEEVDMEGELLEEDEFGEGAEAEEGEAEEGEEGEGSGLYEDVEEEIAGEDEEEGGEEGEVEEEEEVRGGVSRSGGERQGPRLGRLWGGGDGAERAGGGRERRESAGGGGDGGDGGAEASGAAGRQAGRGNLWGGFGLFGGIGGLRPGGTGGGGGAAREGRGGAGEGGEEQEPGPDSGGGAVAVGQRRTGAAAPAAGVAPREAADTTRGPFSPRSPPVAAPPPRMPPLLPPSPHAAVLPFSPHPTMLTGTSTSPPRPPPNRTPPTATQPGALPQVNTIGIPMTANPLNLLPLTAPANPAAATAAEAAGAGIPAGARVMVFVGNPPRLLGEVPEGELEPFLRALPQGAVTVLRAGEIGLPEGAGPAAVATNMAASFMEQQQVEVLFVLCALCGGKRKEAVQDQLAGLGLVAILVDSFDRLNWSAPLPPPAEPHGIHGPGCSCNPESALKIQYLRLIHNFCDRDGPNLHNKLLLASPGGVPPPLAAAAGTPTLIAASGIAASASTPGSTTAGGGAGGGATISGGSSSSSGSSGGVGGRVQASTQGEGNGDGQGQGEGEGEEQGYALGFGASLGRALGFSPNQWLPGLGMRDGAGDSGVVSQAVGVGSSRAEGSSAIAAGGGTEAAAAAGAGGVVEGGGGEEAKKEALMLKIIRVLMKESADSVYRFWLASCVEAFLRGSNPRDQQLVAATGLMEHLVEEILRGASGFKCAASLQIDFDLLGELVKFNPVLFRRLAVLVKGERFSRFIEVLVAHLVDSNVFIRSVMLSLHAFRTGLPTPPYLGPCPTPALPPPVLSPALPSTSAAPSAAPSLAALSSKASSSSPAPALQSSSAATAAASASGEEEAKKEMGLAADGGDADAGDGRSDGDDDGGDANSSSGEGADRRGREREEESAFKGTLSCAAPLGVSEGSAAAAQTAADRKGKKKVEEGERSVERGSLWEAKGKAKGKGVMGEGSVEEEEEELASPLAAFMECNSVLLLRDLMLVVRLGDINQDNICVLNTALIFFIFANRNAQLLSLLAALRAADKAQPASLAASTTLLQPSAPSSPASPSSPSSSSPSSSPSSRSPSFLSKPPSSALLNPSLLPEPLSSTSEDSSSGVGPGSVMKNFRALLDFWREYYLRKRGRDCASLQFSTNIPFTEWLRVVEMLCAPPDCPTSLLYCPPLPASGSQCSSVGLRVDPPPRRC
ncbi:unnamed protein product [Closterium sp. NIES-53]